MKTKKNLANKTMEQRYEYENKIKILILFLGGVSIIISGIYFMTLGTADTTFGQVIDSIIITIKGELQSAPTENKIIIMLRLPRIVMAIIAGIGLSIAGVAMQGITRNSLVSPFTIGISSAAAFGASIAIVFGIGIMPHTEIGIVINAFISSMACAALVYSVSSKMNMKAEAIVLIGIALNYLFSAMTATIEFFAQEHRLAAVVQWTFGSFNGITWSKVLIVSLIVILCSLLIYRYYLSLNIMSTGEDELVKSLGINPGFIRGLMGLLSVIMTSTIISFTGVIGFVGLVAPHIARLLVGNNHKFLIPFSGLAGAMLLLLADTLGKTILSPVNIPVGIVVSFLGVPLFINLILKKRKEII